MKTDDGEYPKLTELQAHMLKNLASERIGTAGWSPTMFAKGVSTMISLMKIKCTDANGITQYGRDALAAHLPS